MHFSKPKRIRSPPKCSRNVWPCCKNAKVCKPVDCCRFHLPVIVRMRKSCELKARLDKEEERWRRKVARWNTIKREEEYVQSFFPDGLKSLLSNIMSMALKEQPDEKTLWLSISDFVGNLLDKRTRKETKTAIFYHHKNLPCGTSTKICDPKDDLQQDMPQADLSEDTIVLPLFEDEKMINDPDTRARICRDDDVEDHNKYCDSDLVDSNDLREGSADEKEHAQKQIDDDVVFGGQIGKGSTHSEDSLFSYFEEGDTEDKEQDELKKRGEMMNVLSLSNNSTDDTLEKERDNGESDSETTVTCESSDEDEEEEEGKIKREGEDSDLEITVSFESLYEDQRDEEVEEEMKEYSENKNLFEEAEGKNENDEDDETTVTRESSEENEEEEEEEEGKEGKIKREGEDSDLETTVSFESFYDDQRDEEVEEEMKENNEDKNLFEEDEGKDGNDEDVETTVTYESSEENEEEEEEEEGYEGKIKRESEDSNLENTAGFESLYDDQRDEEVEEEMNENSEDKNLFEEDEGKNGNDEDDEKQGDENAEEESDSENGTKLTATDNSDELKIEQSIANMDISEPNKSVMHDPEKLDDTISNN